MDDLGIRNNLIGLIIGAIPTTSKAAIQALDQLSIARRSWTRPSARRERTTIGCWRTMFLRHCGSTR